MITLPGVVCPDGKRHTATLVGEHRAQVRMWGRQLVTGFCLSHGAETAFYPYLAGQDGVLRSDVVYVHVLSGGKPRLYPRLSKDRYLLCSGPPCTPAHKKSGQSPLDMDRSRLWLVWQPAQCVAITPLPTASVTILEDEYGTPIIPERIVLPKWREGCLTLEGLRERRVYGTYVPYFHKPVTTFAKVVPMRP